MPETKQSNLRYVSSDTKGFSRQKRGRGFSYFDTKGELIRDEDLREWIESLAIPPAWTDVWISPYKNTHILATGRDDRGRKQYRYHPNWQETHKQKKFHQLVEFGQHLPEIRRVTEEDLRGRKLSRRRVLAAIVRLLEETLIRIGNSEYARSNDSYGLTTLEDSHARIRGDKVEFDFVGKSGIDHSVSLRDRRLATIVQQCQDIPGYELFQYYDDNAEHQIVDSADVNAYLQEITGEPFTAKVFRTWGGSILAIKYLCENDDDSAAKQSIQDCIQHVADSLGNTKTICRNYYVHPAILDAYNSGELIKIYKQSKKQTSNGLLPEEKTLIQLIKLDESD